jgi:hypothetical protein
MNLCKGPAEGPAISDREWLKVLTADQQNFLARWGKVVYYLAADIDRLTVEDLAKRPMSENVVLGNKFRDVAFWLGFSAAEADLKGLRRIPNALLLESWARKYLLQDDVVITLMSKENTQTFVYRLAPSKIFDSEVLENEVLKAFHMFLDYARVQYNGSVEGRKEFIQQQKIRSDWS